MPFQSESQRRYLWANDPEVARRWAHEYPNQGKLPMHKKAEGGAITGQGDGKSDSIPAKIKKGSFIVPIEHAFVAEQLRQKYLEQDGKSSGKDADLDQENGEPIMLSNGEHLFAPHEAKIIDKNMKQDGLGSINKLAPKAKRKFKLSDFTKH